MTENPLFIDTSYIYALTNPRDQWHQKALKWRIKVRDKKLTLITTEFILAEIADGLSSLKFRQDAVRIIHLLEENPFIEIVPATSELFKQALKLYQQRHDKDWGLTDCTSFVVMNENDLSNVLTTDQHFRQAGFNALLID